MCVLCGRKIREKPSIEKVTEMSKSIYSKGILIVEDSKEYALSPIPSLDSAKLHSN
jgi:hypothetical protein